MDVPPVRHFLGGAGELVTSGSAQALSEVILNILKDETQFKYFSKKGINQIKEQYNWNIP